MGISVSIIGVGLFAEDFLQVFAAHPDIREVAVFDRDVERAHRVGAEYGADRVFTSEAELLESPIDAVAIFTPRWTHADLAVQHLEAGRHVLSAVPMGVTVEEVQRIVTAAEESGKRYMMAETSYYYPAVVYCRQRFARGDFGSFVYGEGQYHHDMDTFQWGYRRALGDMWKSAASLPPLYYGTHSLAGVLAVTGAEVMSVYGLGVRDRAADGVFDPLTSDWDNPYSNEVALYRTTDGGIVRVSEFRRIGSSSEVFPEVRFNLAGTEAVFEQNALTSVWQSKQQILDVSDLLRARPEPSTGHLIRDVQLGGYAQVHDSASLPVQLAGLPNGHEGSHHFLVHEFVQACIEDRPPAVDHRRAASFTVPGVLAHDSAMRGGAVLDVPQFQKS